jgi:hypothetical protein
MRATSLVLPAIVQNCNSLSVITRELLNSSEIVLSRYLAMRASSLANRWSISRIRCLFSRISPLSGSRTSSENVGPLADVPLGDCAVQDERIALGVFLGVFSGGENTHRRKRLVEIVEESACHKHLAIGVQLLRSRDMCEQTLRIFGLNFINRVVRTHADENVVLCWVCHSDSLMPLRGGGWRNGGF